MPPNDAGAGFPGLYPPKTIWILGAGRFGRLAAERLRKRYPESELLVVDDREERLSSLEEDLGLPVHAGDALPFLGSRDVPEGVWIVPAIPVHVAFQWILLELKKRGDAAAHPVPDALDALVPNPLRREGTVYASYADFICPDACSEPEDICTHTGKPRRGNLFEHLGRISLPGFRMVVVRSLQLAPGVGGYPGRRLREALETIAAFPGRHIVATACRCHGVIDGLTWTPAGQAG